MTQYLQQLLEKLNSVDESRIAGELIGRVGAPPGDQSPLGKR